MEFSIKSGAPEKQRSACVVVGVFETRKLSAAAAALDRAAGGYLSEVLGHGDMDGKAGATLLLHRVPGTHCERVLLVGLGKEKDFGDKGYREAVAAAVRAVQATGAADAALYLTDLRVGSRDAHWRASQAVQAAARAVYRFDRLKSKKEDKRPLKRITLELTERGELAAGEAGLNEGKAIAAGAALARDLGNLPGNVCTPAYLADQAQALAKAHRGLKCTVLEPKDMEKLGMGALLSVARGSRQPARLIVLEYRGGARNAKPVALVGKGVTFDSGGISIKPSAEMDEMKFDMCGAASVLGTMKTAALLGLKLNVVAVIPATENLPDGNASKPGDVVTSMSGQTIEILNTDAEGRLILCDALTYCERYEPDTVVDVATLTGSCVIALGHVATGLFSNNDALAQELLGAGERAWDRAWHMPLWEDYQEQLKTNFADMANVGGRPAGSVTAACFLSRFAKKFHWAHLDIAGTAWKSGKEKGATGRPVGLLSQFLIGRAGPQR